jgi:histone H3/H4
MREIRQYQQTNGTLLPKTLFQRLVKEIADDYQVRNHVSLRYMY